MKKIFALILLVALFFTGCGRREQENLTIPWSGEIEEVVSPIAHVPIEVVHVTEKVEEVEVTVEEDNEGFIEEPTVVEPEEPTVEKVSLGTYVLTAYCSCQQCCGQYALNRPLDENGNPIVYTASGNRAVAGVTIAVDPTVIPYGTKVEINGHVYTAHDTGSAIKGNRIDVYFADHSEAWNFGKQEAEVFLVKE